MNRLRNYLKIFLLPDFKKKGYLYLSDENLFVIDELSKILKSINFDLKFTNSASRKNQLIELKDLVELNNFFEKERRNKILILINYQLFLDEKGFDNRFKKKVRGLITKEILKYNREIKLEKEKYFYFQDQIDIYFIRDLSGLISFLNLTFNRKNNNLFYRGHSNLDWDLEPSIYRKSWIENEHKMFREIILRNSEEFIKTKSTFEKLTIMQHYGLPTRLLDITKNPLVALFFACSDKSQLDSPGEVIIFNPSPEIIKYYDSDTVSVISNLSKCERNLKIILNKTQFNNSIEGKKLLHFIKEEKPYFDANIVPQDLFKSLIVRPINNNERIKRQLGYFYLVGVDKIITKSSKIKANYSIGNLPFKLFVEEKNKSKLLSELEVVGISSDTLFPEIENGTSYIKSKY